MKKLLNILALFVICIFQLNSQLSKIFVLNEGSFDFVSGQITVPVSLGVFDVNSKTYQQISEIPNARFASDLLIHENSIWIAADKYLIEFNLNTLTHIRTKEIEGIRKLAIKDELIIVTRGEYLKNLNSYVQILNKMDFSLLFEIPETEMGFTTENIVVKDRVAYIGVNNGFVFGQEVGKILKIDLDSLKWNQTIDLGVDGKNPENLMLYEDVLLSLNNKDFTGSSVSVIDLKNNEVRNHNLADVQSLCGTSTLMKSGVIYQEFGETTLGRYDITGNTSSTFKELNDAVYGMSFSENFNVLCAGVTDFKSFGKVFVYDKDINELYNFNTSIAPGYFAFQGISVNTKHENASLDITVSPNPVLDYCYIESSDNIEEITLFDMMGSQILKQSLLKINTRALASGTYILKVRSKHKSGKTLLVKY
ncbi:MAG: T9SS type A sorting domain-containing protein [Saprospiraceae bacterium]|nr:T9SS type A sorting domain-containing protein [Saprospiraceae bacterium]